MHQIGSSSSQAGALAAYCLWSREPLGRKVKKRQSFISTPGADAERMSYRIKHDDRPILPVRL
jgi:hypothetical protein